ncbi:MAG: hypothetical protein HZY76_12505 [Anaerolineae bacterium]|nr:MAG: hypothetical protein HZY76_12505 [Anaerolineae bacterium]
MKTTNNSAAAGQGQCDNHLGGLRFVGQQQIGQEEAADESQRSRQQPVEPAPGHQ